MDLPDYDNAKKWLDALRRKPWPWFLLSIVVVVGGYWWFQRFQPGTASVAVHKSDLKGSPVSPSYNAGRDMAVYNIGSVNQSVAGARPEEIGSLRRLATASIFKTADDPLRKMVSDNLERIRKASRTSLPTVTISADQANPNRLRIADEMGELLRTSGFEVKVLGGTLYSASQEPIRVIFRPKDRELAEAILMAFEPILHANVGAQEVVNRPGDEILVLIKGEPKFTPEGIKVFE